MGIPSNPQQKPANFGATGAAGSTTTGGVPPPPSQGTGGNTGGNTGGSTGGINNNTNGGSVSSGSSSGTQITIPPPGGAGTGAGVGGSSGTGSTSTPSVDLTNPDGAFITFKSFLNDAWMNDPNLNINALVQAVLRNSYQDNQQDLKDYALKVEFYNNLKKNIRSEIARARSYQSANAGTNGTTQFTNGGFHAQATGYDGYNGSAQVNNSEGNNWGASGVNPGNGMDAFGVVNNANDLNNYISTMEEYLTSVGDDAQLAQVDLQNMAQNQQQTLQTLSNLSKSFNDVSMAIIRNIQG